MRAAINLDALEWAPKVALAVALTAWTAAFAGMLAQGARGARRRSTKATTRPDH